MIEIIAVIYSVSFLMTWTAALYHFRNKLKPHFESGQFQILEMNLKKVGLSWSHKDSDFFKFDAAKAKKEVLAAYKSFFMMAAFCSLLSFLGFLLFFLILKTGHSRKERIVFTSELARDQTLEADKILKIIEDFKASI